MNPQDSASRERILISGQNSRQDQTPESMKLARKWRSTSIHLTWAGGIIALIALGLIFSGPAILKKQVIDRFWNTPYQGSSGSILSSMIYVVFWDEDHGHILSYALSIFVASFFFLATTNLVDYLGISAYREASSD
jgi:hypothetical protein